MSAVTQIAPGVVLHPPGPAGDDHQVVELPDRRLARVSTDVGRLLDVLGACTEPPTPAALAERLGSPWTEADVDTTLRQLAELGITGAGRAPTRARRIEYRPPLALQLTLIDGARLYRWLRPLAGALTGRTVPALAML